MPDTQSITSSTRHVNPSALAVPPLPPRNLSQIGTKAPLSAPSDSRRRKKLTTWRTANNVSEEGPAPNSAAIQASRA